MIVLKKSKTERIKESSFRILTESTIHGIPSILKTNYLFSKISWAVSTLACLVICLVLVENSISAYLENNVVTSIKVWKKIPLDFPVVSFCNLNLLKPKYNLSDILIICEFNSIRCTSDQFSTFYDLRFGLCYRFNFDGTFKSIKPGKLNGLFFDIFTGIDQDIIEIGATSTGLHVYIHNSSNMPSISEGLETATGLKTSLMIKQIFNYRQPDPYNDCQKNLKFFESPILKDVNISYRQKDCFDLKFLEKFSTICNYSGNFYEITKNFRLKLLGNNGLNEFNCLNKAYMDFYNDTLLDKKYPDCLQECDSMNYDISTSVSKFPSKLYYANILKNNEKLKTLFNGNFTYEQLSERFLEICVYFENLEYTEITQQIETTLVDLISNIGGILGLFLGMSFLSFFEFIEIIVEIIYIFLKK